MNSIELDNGLASVENRREKNRYMNRLHDKKFHKRLVLMVCLISIIILLLHIFYDYTSRKSKSHMEPSLNITNANCSENAYFNGTEIPGTDGTVGTMVVVS
ncbi:hypothetical protein EDEG_03740 [Edhazardia aedis USNM 41457]|uniref:Uncharacterized protein n=1 Tax=Edhazardia aedis (strain USNM 41457) TaxID=1003232 RepID=J9DGK7_EDHAE|nr:hypothetical protein EDEG_03740 [Edhazardia aedis USNM 41457]|eukprot:EJW01735.1 hypothetical protein EDEG_03740 [Edhazardia aedis USNM 41457]